MKKNFFSWCIGIFAVLLGIFVISIGYSAYQYYLAIHADDPIDPYVLVESGSTRIVRGNLTISLEKEEKYNIREKDTIIVAEDSSSTVFWPDHSTTQLGAWSQFAIAKMQVSEDYSQIDIEATLLEGKIYTNMIRTLYPGSKMRVNVPRHNIVAGVRGTVFSLNLEDNYIHSVDHAVMLENKFFAKSLLLPGEIAPADNIFARLGRDMLDQVWEDAVALKNTAYEVVYNEKISSAWNKLTGKMWENSLWDQFMREILSWFDAFNDIEIMEKISSLDVSQVVEIPREKLLDFYQKFKVGDFVLERDVLRGAIHSVSSADAKMQEILETLASESLWEKLEFPSLDLKNSEKILDDFGQKMTIDIDALIQKMDEKNYWIEMIDSIGEFFTIDFAR